MLIDAMVAVACPLIGFGFAMQNYTMLGVGLMLFFGSYLVQRT